MITKEEILSALPDRYRKQLDGYRLIKRYEAIDADGEIIMVRKSDKYVVTGYKVIEVRSHYMKIYYTPKDKYMYIDLQEFYVFNKRKESANRKMMEDLLETLSTR